MCSDISEILQKIHNNTIAKLRNTRSKGLMKGNSQSGDRAMMYVMKNHVETVDILSRIMHKMYLHKLY